MKSINTPIPNGRMDIINAIPKAFPFFVERDKKFQLNRGATSVYEVNELQIRYFSGKNIEYLQREIRIRVYGRAKYVIQDQDVNELQIVMKSVYFQYGKNLREKVNEQMDTLNEIVLNYCVNNIISNIELYMTYKKNVSYTPVPLELPKYISSSGLKTKKNFID